MTKKKALKTENINEKIEADLSEINSMEGYISEILDNDNFNTINVINTNKDKDFGLASKEAVFNALKKREENIEFISLDMDTLSPYVEMISEKEFYKIVGFKNNKLSSSAGLYQESLFGHYLDAKENQDPGYISDVLNKAIVFQNNLEYVKGLMKNKKFMHEWRKDFGNLSPAVIFKNDGNLRKINIVKERTL